MPDLWETLHVGDRVRVIEFQREFRRRGALHPETRRAYKYLVRRRRPLIVAYLDEYKFPWVYFQFHGKDGRMEYHSMALNHSGVHLIRPRKRGRRS